MFFMETYKSSRSGKTMLVFSDKKVDQEELTSVQEHNDTVRSGSITTKFAGIAVQTYGSFKQVDSGDQVIDGKIQDLASIYLTLPIGDSGAYVKAGYIQATFITSENLATGSKYEDIDLTGTQVGGGYEAPLGDMAFWRAEGSMQMWEDISASGSESGGTSGSKNKIAAELGSVVGTLSVGMKF